MKIGIIQYSPLWENTEKNFEYITHLFDENAFKCDLIILPEMSLTGFTMNAKDFAEDFDGSVIPRFISLAGKYKVHIFAGIIEKDGEKIFNSLFHFNDQGIIAARYRKIHRFTFAKEDKFYSESKEPVITKINSVKIGLSVCYDLRFPELYRLYVKEGAEILIDIANWPIPRIEHWSHLLKARAIENLAFMIGVNRTGTDPFNHYSGESACYSPMGKEIFNAHDQQGFFTFEIDTEEVKKIRNEFPFLNDIRLI